MAYQTYTKARRFPLVIGQIGGFALPTPFTLPQAFMFIGLNLTEILTRQYWLPYTHSKGIAIAIILPFLVVYLMSHLPTQGRSVFAIAQGYVNLWFSRPLTNQVQEFPIPSIGQVLALE